MPRPAVHYQDTACGTCCLHLSGIRFQGGQPPLAPDGLFGDRWRPRDNQGAAGFMRKWRKHPQRSQVYHSIGIGGGYMSGVVLIEGPICV